MRACVRVGAAAGLTLLVACAVTQHEVTVRSLPESEVPSAPAAERDIGLCLSGGGYRAVAFHTGLLRELNARGLLPRLRSVTGVSAGAIVGATLAVVWDELEYDADGRALNLDELVSTRLGALTETTLDVGAVLSTFNANGSSLRVANGYAEALFGDRRLADLPAGPDAPSFVFLATELVTGLNWEFARDRMGEMRLGYLPAPDLRLADAVAASSAFPAVFRPIRVSFANDTRVLVDPAPGELERVTVTTLRQMGRSDLAARLETEGLSDADRAALRAEIRAFRDVAFAGKVDDNVYLIDGGLVNNFGSEYCEANGLDIISNASLRWIGEIEPEPSGLIDSMAQIIVAMRRYAEAYQLEAIYQRDIIGRRFGAPCDADLHCPQGTVALVELSPRELGGEIPEELRIGARLRALSADQRRALTEWGEARTAATLDRLQAE